MAGEGSALISSVCSPSAGGTLPSCPGACDAGAVTPLNPLPAPQNVPPEDVAPEDAPPQDAAPEDAVAQDTSRPMVDEPGPPCAAPRGVPPRLAQSAISASEGAGVPGSSKEPPVMTNGSLAGAWSTANG